MITLPSQFVETKYPGYFWNTNDEKLYSIKIDGVLKPLKQYDLLWKNTYSAPLKLRHYRVSIKGARRILYVTSYLKKLKLPTNHTIPIQKGTELETTT